MPKKEMQNIVDTIENELAKVYTEPSEFIEYTSFNTALNYTLLAGGKRIRPLLLLLFSEICASQSKKKFSIDDCMPAALALEMVHTYSLIHDDLPAMDNDDLRRGKPTCHKQFDEATAILAGDALLTDAFSMLAKADFAPEYVLKAIDFLSKCAGSRGMVAGQILDMAMEDKEGNIFLKNNISIKEALSTMNARKTGDLLLASCCIPAILYNNDEKFYNECSLFAYHFGLAFQISDDILDVVGDSAIMGKPQGSDISANKSTWVSLFGLEGANKEVAKHIEEAHKLVEAWSSSYPIDTMTYQILDMLLQSLANRLK